jgi:hypothetical protein
LDENHPFSNFPLKIEASLGELNPTEIKEKPENVKFSNPDIYHFF